jgi:hypothetical protein
METLAAAAAALEDQQEQDHSLSGNRNQSEPTPACTQPSQAAQPTAQPSAAQSQQAVPHDVPGNVSNMQSMRDRSGQSMRDRVTKALDAADSPDQPPHAYSPNPTGGVGLQNTAATPTDHDVSVQPSTQLQQHLQPALLPGSQESAANAVDSVDEESLFSWEDNGSRLLLQVPAEQDKQAEMADALAQSPHKPGQLVVKQGPCDAGDFLLLPQLRSLLQGVQEVTLSRMPLSWPLAAVGV